MSHQDKDRITSAAETLKELFAQNLPDDDELLPRHGNASISTSTLVITALMAFGFSCGKNLSQRIGLACDAAASLLGPRMPRFTSRQGLFKALRTGGEQLWQQVRTRIAQRLAQNRSWLLYGRPTLAVDGSRWLLSRTKANQAYFAPACRKKATKYKKRQDHAKAATTQCNFSLCSHLGSSLPWCWRAADSSQGERELLLELLDQVAPGKSLGHGCLLLWLGFLESTAGSGA